MKSGLTPDGVCKPAGSICGPLQEGVDMAGAALHSTQHTPCILWQEQTTYTVTLLKLGYKQHTTYTVYHVAGTNYIHCHPLKTGIQTAQVTLLKLEL